MKYFIGLSLLFVFIACAKSSDKANDSLIGRWKITEYLADPGDGSGTWMQANNDYTIQFNNDSTVHESSAQNKSINRYSLPGDSTLILFYSDGTNQSLYYKIKKNTLTIMGGCIEACGTKYKRTDVLFN